MNQPLPEPFPVQRFALRATVTRTLELPEFSGSMLRGAFGHVLRDTPLYRRIFAPSAPSAPHKRHASRPPPYVIEPPPAGARLLHPGASLEFNLILIGAAIALAEPLATAWELALARPLGPRQGTARLDWMRRHAGESGQQTAGHETAPDALHIPPCPAGITGVRLEFETPLCLRSKGHYLGTADLDARHLLRAAVRRAADVTQLTLGIPFTPDYTALAPRIDAMRLEKCLAPRSWERYSSRQNRKMRLGGLVGSCRLHGPVAPFWPFIYLGQWLHLGKETTFGLGRYRLEAMVAPG